MATRPEPDVENVVFQTNFEGAIGATAVADESIYKNDPVFLGGAQIDDRASIFGTTSARVRLTDQDPAGAITIPGVEGIDFGQSDFFIEFFYWLLGGTSNHTLMGIGAINEAPGEPNDRVMELFYLSNGRLALRLSRDGVLWLPSLINANQANSGGWYYIAIQQYQGAICAWFAQNFADQLPDLTGRTAARRAQGFEPSPLHASLAPVRFGSRATGTFENCRAANIGPVRIVVGEALFPDCPETIPLPTQRFVLPCIPTLVFPIDDVTLFLGETYSRDYSLFFGSPGGRKNTFTASGLPPGLAIATNGVISGAVASPATEGQTYNVTITATNECGTVDGTFDITVGTTVAGVDNFFFLHSAS